MNGRQVHGGELSHADRLERFRGTPAISNHEIRTVPQDRSRPSPRGRWPRGLDETDDVAVGVSDGSDAPAPEIRDRLLRTWREHVMYQLLTPLPDLVAPE
jgi:hypothetical protein